MLYHELLPQRLAVSGRISANKLQRLANLLAKNGWDVLLFTYTTTLDRW